MKKEVAKKWVKALRSGKYKQGDGCLKQTDTKKNKTYHCCLGVLCELYNEQMTKSKKKKLNDVVDKYGLHSFDKEVEVLPDSVRDWADLMGKTGSFSNDIDTYDGYGSLSAMNDLGCSFKKIANTIDKEWENL
jgi:hypothetical protein